MAASFAAWRTTQAVIDTFVAIGGLTALVLLLIVSHKRAPIGPASAPPLFAPQDAKST